MSSYKNFWVWFLLSLTAPGLLGLSTAVPSETDRVNILFISIDDLNDWVGFLHGHPQAKTPNMDRLAARGTVFANAHCAAPVCCPSRAAVFSGREPFNTGVYGNGDDISRIAPELVLLPTQMKSHGYRTLGAGKLLHRARPDLFDEFFKPEQRWSPFASSAQLAYTPEELPSKATDNPRHVVDMGKDRPPVILPLNRMPSDRRPHQSGAESFDWGPFDVPDNAMGDAQIVDWAIERMNEERAQPFFLALGFYRPHIPLWAPTKYFEPFTNTYLQMPPFLATDLDDLGPVARDVAITPRSAGAHATVMRYDQWTPAVAAYLACVYFVDAQIGRLLDALEASGHDRNTAVIIWGDHGWHLGEKQHWGKSTGWERSTRVPLLIVPPLRDRDQFAVGQSTREPVSLIDMYPTVLEVANVPPPSTGLDGRSLVPLLRDPKLTTGRAVVSTFLGEHFSVGDERWRFIRYADGSEELYDHRLDPNEWENLARDPAHSSVKARLARSLPKEPKGLDQLASNNGTGVNQAKPRAERFEDFPKPVQDAVIRELGPNPTLLAAEERRSKQGAEYTVKTKLPDDHELQLRLLPNGHILIREVSGLTLDQTPEAIRATAKKELGELATAPGVQWAISKKTKGHEITFNLVCKSANQNEARLDIYDNGKPADMRVVKQLADLPQRVLDTIKMETARTPGAAVTVKCVAKYDWNGDPTERFYTADVRADGLAVDLKIDERGYVIDREEK